MKKKDVYVVVDTPKKAKKLKRLFDMFGEKTFRSNSIDNCLKGFNLTYDFELYWFETGCFHVGKTEVSIKELRNILAKEHLKEGDCFVDCNKYVFTINKINEDDTINCSCLTHSTNGDLSYEDFIRYATEEEKSLLEPKKELEVWKWYKGNVDIQSLIFITEIENVKYYNRIHGYGFIDGEWANSGHLFSNTDHEKSLVEASFEDVKQELIKEAKRLGHNYERYSYDSDENILCGYNGRLEEIFVDGVWNEPYDKLSNLKEAFNNGYCVEFYDGETVDWKRHENPCWNPDLQWRIMVNNGHIVISDVYLLNQIKELKKSIEEIKSNIK